MLFIVIFVGLFQRLPFLFSTTKPESRAPFISLLNYDSHIIDEKVYYYEQYGLFSPWRFAWPKIRPQSEVLPSKYINLCGFVGWVSITMPSHYLIDQCALIDPFVSRIPAVQDWELENWSSFKKSTN